MLDRIGSRRSELGTMITQVDSPRTVDQILSRTNEMAVLPHVVHKVLDLTSGDDCGSRDLDRLIEIDPGFCSRVLQLANSAGFGLPKRVTSVHEAVMFLGHRTIRTIALTIGLFDIFVGKTDSESMRRREWWRHSVDTAICCRELASTDQDLSKDEAYTSGLLHLIGKMLLDRYGGKNYGLVQKMIESGAEDYEAEKEIFGFDHCDVASEAAKRWDLPAALQGSMFYLSPPAADDQNAKLRACTLVGSRMAETAKNGENADSLTCPSWALEQLGLVGVTMSELGLRGRRAITEAELKI